MLDAVAYQHADRLGAGPDPMLGSPLVEGRQFARRNHNLNTRILLVHGCHLHKFLDLGKERTYTQSYTYLDGMP